MKGLVGFAAVLAFFGVVALAEPPSLVPPDTIVQSYWAASRSQAHSLDGASMEVEIDAALPKLKKHGRLFALRRISALGRITYEHFRFEGDGTVKKDVIARYLKAEIQSQNKKSSSLGVTPENYKFKYKKMVDYQGRNAYVFRVSPRKKKVGLFKGELWIDTQTFLRLRESGRFVKNPSIFLKRVEFVREYEIREGISVPLKIQTTVDTRLVGKAELTVDFTKVSLADSPLTKRAGLVRFFCQ